MAKLPPDYHDEVCGKEAQSILPEHEDHDMRIELDPHILYPEKWVVELLKECLDAMVKVFTKQPNGELLNAITIKGQISSSAKDQLSWPSCRLKDETRRLISSEKPQATNGKHPSHADMDYALLCHLDLPMLPLCFKKKPMCELASSTYKSICGYMVGQEGVRMSQCRSTWHAVWPCEVKYNAERATPGWLPEWLKTRCRQYSTSLYLPSK